MLQSMGSERVGDDLQLKSSSRRKLQDTTETAFLVRVKTASKLGIKARFGVMDFSTSKAIQGQWFFS